MKLGLVKTSMVFVLTLLIGAPATAQTVALIDYTGFAWETGGIPRSDPGDVLAITGVALTVDPLFDLAPSTQEVTIYIHDLVVANSVTLPDGSTSVDYAGGMIEVYEDGALNHDWGTMPPNAQLATFTDGALLFSGAFTRFNLVLNTLGFGVYDGDIDGIGGTAANLCFGAPDCAYTFGGAFGRDVGAQIPTGYDLQIDGTLEVDAAVSNEEASFGAIKSLYR